MTLPTTGDSLMMTNDYNTDNPCDSTDDLCWCFIKMRYYDVYSRVRGGTNDCKIGKKGLGKGLV